MLGGLRKVNDYDDDDDGDVDGNSVRSKVN